MRKPYKVIFLNTFKKYFFIKILGLGVILLKITLNLLILLINSVTPSISHITPRIKHLKYLGIPTLTAALNYTYITPSTVTISYRAHARDFWFIKFVYWCKIPL